MPELTDDELKLVRDTSDSYPTLMAAAAAADPPIQQSTLIAVRRESIFPSIRFLRAIAKGWGLDFDETPAHHVLAKKQKGTP